MYWNYGLKKWLAKSCRRVKAGLKNPTSLTVKVGLFFFQLRTNKKLNKHSLKVFIRVHAVVDGFPCTRGVVACRQLNDCFLVRNVEGFVTDALLGFLKERTGSAAICRHDGPLWGSSDRSPVVTLALLPTALDLRRDMRLPKSLSESSLSACFRLGAAFAFFAMTVASASESLVSHEGALVVDGALGLDQVSVTGGCFNPKWHDQTVQLWPAICWF